MRQGKKPGQDRPVRQEKQDIMVIGGYGHVGAQICTLLGRSFPGKVYAAGRSLEKARRFCDSTGGAVRPLRFDLAEPVDPQWLKRVKLVVMCLDQQDPAFLLACLRSGTDYVDVSANGAFFAALDALGDSAGPLHGTAVLSVGLAPGLTNLLAARASRALAQTRSIDISVMLGLGDSHGQAAIEWTVDNLHAAYPVTEAGRQVTVRSFSGGQATDFGGNLGRRKAYRFPFSDQQTLPRTLQVPSVATRLCFDSRLSTAVLALLQPMGLLRLLKRPRIRRAAVAAFGRFRFGSERYAIKIDARGQKNGRPAVCEYGIQGSREADITAKTAAAAAKAVYTAALPPGIFHMEQLFTIGLTDNRLTLGLAEQATAANAAGAAAASPVSSAAFTAEIDDVFCWSRETLD